MHRELYDFGVGIALKVDDEIILYIKQELLVDLEDMKDGEVIEIDDDRFGNSGLILALDGNFKWCRRAVNNKTMIDQIFCREDIDIANDKWHLYDYRITGKEDETKAREAEIKAARLKNNKTINQDYESRVGIK